MAYTGFYEDIDLNKNSIFLFKPHPITTAARNTLGGTLGTSDEGIFVYDTSLDSHYFWDGTQWIQLSGTSTDSWNILGNTGTDANTNFIGTTDYQAFAGRVNNVPSLWLAPLSVNPYLDGIYISNIFIGPNAGKLARGTEKANIAIGSNAFSSYQNLVSGTGANIAIGAEALRDYLGTGSEANTAIGFRALARTTTGFRNTALGLNAGHNNTTALFGTFIGAFAGEWQSTGQANQALGFGCLRNNTIGIANTAVGPVALEMQSGQIHSITVTNGGSGYTNATVTVTPYDAQPFGFLGNAQQCLATATINAGVITGITVTQIGRNYTSATVTITGDGTGATATAVISSPNFNVAVGGNAGWQNQTGSDNVFVGVQAGYAGGGNFQSMYDGRMTLIGPYASRDSSIANTTAMTNATAIGYNAKVGKSNAIVLGATGADRVDVGIGLVNPLATLHLNKTLTANTSDLTSGLRLTNPNPATNILSNRSLATVYEAFGWRTGDALSTQVYAQQYLNTFSGTSTPSGRLTSEVTLPQTGQTTKLELVSGADLRLYSPISGTSLVRYSLYDVANTLVGQFYNNVGAARMGIYQGVNNGFIGFETVATADGNQIRGFVNNTGIGSSFGIFAGPASATPCAILEGASTTRGFLPPRMSEAQRDAIGSPVAGLMVYQNNNTPGLRYFDGTSWLGFENPLTFDNGLTRTGNNVQLGGTLTNFSTSIDGVNNGRFFDISNILEFTVQRLDSSQRQYFTFGDQYMDFHVPKTSDPQVFTTLTIQPGNYEILNSWTQAHTGSVVAGSDADMIQSAGGGKVYTLIDVFGEASVGYMKFLQEHTISTGQPITEITTAKDATFTNQFLQNSTGTHIWAKPVSVGGTYKGITVGLNGELNINAYGSGTITGTMTRVLAVDSSGDVIEVTSGSLAGTLDEVMANSSILTTTRVIDADSNDFGVDNANTITLTSDNGTTINGDAGVVGNLDISGNLSVGSGPGFQVDSSGNITEINNVATSWPASQGAANSYLKNDGSGNLSWDATIAAGTYTPTITLSTNTDSSSAFKVMWTRIGNVVNFSGTILINATAAGAATVEISLPFASDFTSGDDAAGTVVADNGSANFDIGFVGVNISTNRLVISVNASTINDNIYKFTGSYHII